MQHCGLVRVPTDLVVRTTQRTLQTIFSTRSYERRRFVENYLHSAEWWWWRLGRWLAFSKPTRRDAIMQYYHGSKLPRSFEVKLMFAAQESICKKVLQAAQQSEQPTMWLSPESIQLCNVR